jgi:hypothetical protein
LSRLCSAHNRFLVEATDEEVDASVTKNLGRILVEVQRVFKYKKDYTPSPPSSPDQGLDFDTVSEIAEKALKGQAIENAIKCFFLPRFLHDEAANISC